MKYILILLVTTSFNDRMTYFPWFVFHIQFIVTNKCQSLSKFFSVHPTVVSNIFLTSLVHIHKTNLRKNTFV